MLAFSIDYYGIFFRATQSVELFCTYKKPAENKQTAKAVCYLSRYSYSTVYESADSPLRRTAHCLSVREKKSRNGEALLSPSFLLSVYSFGIYIIARNFRSYSRGRVWAEPTKGNNHDALLVMQKNRK